MSTTRPFGESYGHRAAGGAVKVALGQALRVATGLASIIVVARILSPADYGVVAMAAPITTFLAMVQNIGLDQAVIQARSLDAVRLSSLFWVNIALGLAVAVGLLAIAPLAASFYHSPAAGHFVAASAIIALLNVASLLHSALLNRQLRFGAISLADVASSLANFTATLVAALILRNYWALLIGGVAGAAASLVMVWTMERWRPDPRPSFDSVADMLRFGRGITGFNLANFFARNLDNVLIARRWGTIAVGLYDRSYKLMMFPLQNINTPIAGVMLPVLGRLRDQPERYVRAYTLAVRAIQLLAVPGVIVAIAADDRLIGFLLGARWSGVAPIFFWLSIGALIQPSGNPTGWLFMSSDRTHDFMLWGLFGAITSVIAFVVGLPYGAVGVAVCYVATDWLRMPLQFWWATRGSPVRMRDLWAMHGPTVIVLPVVLALNHAVAPLLPTLPLLVVLTVVAYGAMIAVYAFMPAGRELFAMARAMIPFNRAAALETP